MKTIALIPARSGSKRVPDKNIRELKGKPLMAWSIEVAKACENIDEVYLSSDSDEYLKVGRDRGCGGIHRPITLAEDDAQDQDVILDAIGRFQFKPDLVVYLRPTTPFRSVQRVEQAIELMKKTPANEMPSLRSVHEMSESAYKMFKVKGGFLKPLTKQDLTDLPNQKLPKTYCPNGYVDIVRRENVEKGNLWGSRRFAYLTPKTIEIDTEEDFKHAEYLAQSELSTPFVFRSRGKKQVNTR